MKKKLLLSGVLSAMTLTGFALQNALPAAPVAGELQVKAGTGNINPFTAKLQLNLSGRQFTLKPYVGIGVVSKSGSGKLENQHLFYLGSANAYGSHLETSSKGTTYNYGLTGSYRFDPFSQLTFGVDGSYSALHGYGCRIEEMTDMLSSMLQDKALKSDIDQPTLTTTSIKANVAYHHRLKDNIETSFLLKGNISRESTDNETTIQALSGVGQLPFQQNYLHQENVTTSASVGGEYQRLFAGNQAINVGFHYDHRHIESDNLQLIDKDKKTDELFKHDMNVAGLYADYKLTYEALNLNARLEYTYTDMNGKDLHDVIPSVNATYHLTSSQDVQLGYVMRVVRPDVSYLNPAKIYGAYTIDYGTADLEGIHINNFSLAHVLKGKAVRLSNTVSHVRANDGFNAIWMLQNGMRVSFWGNEGIRRAWSVTPVLNWTISPLTSLGARVVVLWDKRIAEAINMSKEHWGITTHLSLKQQLPAGFKLNAHADYSEGNTIDLYSHAGKSVNYGGELQRAFLKGNKLNLSLSYENTDYAKTILTQGVDIPNGPKGYTGTIYSRPKHHHILSVTANWKF